MLNFFFGFDGRIRRTHYFFGALAVGVICVMVGLSGLAAMHYSIGDDDVDWSFNPSPFLIIPMCLLWIAAFWSSLALTVKRWHDVGVTGWFTLLSLPGFTHGAVFLLLCLLPGTTGPNRYGEDPRGRPAPTLPATAATA
jgi:uncharacterized membrane protein YhaH (DUF805 family)